MCRRGGSVRNCAIYLLVVDSVRSSQRGSIATILRLVYLLLYGDSLDPHHHYGKRHRALDWLLHLFLRPLSSEGSPSGRRGNSLARAGYTAGEEPDLPARYRRGRSYFTHGSPRIPM